MELGLWEASGTYPANINPSTPLPPWVDSLRGKPLSVRRLKYAQFTLMEGLNIVKQCFTCVQACWK